MSKILMSVTVDTECDKSINWTNSNPLSFESVHLGLPKILQPMFESFLIKPTYFLSPEVIDDEKCVQVLKSLSNNCELGTHLHADFIEPEKSFEDFSGKGTHAFQTDYTPDVEYEKLANLTNNFKDAFNFSPKVFRAGRFAANANTIHSLIKLNYKVDSSFTPHMKWESPLGNSIDHESSPEQPYFCHFDDIYKHSSNSSLLEIPITIIESNKYLFFNKKVWLRPKFSTINEVKKIINYVRLKYSQNDYIILNMMFHSQEVIPNASPYNRSKADVNNYMNFLEEAFKLAQKEGIQFLTLEEIYDLIKNS
ncbi:hypothetical protein OAC71_00190 [Candidatus Thioglobus sp.]|nr:hypothetical protein [Candidatus Thioglobus sp.]